MVTQVKAPGVGVVLIKYPRANVINKFNIAELHYAKIDHSDWMSHD